MHIQIVKCNNVTDTKFILCLAHSCWNSRKLEHKS